MIRFEETQDIEAVAAIVTARTQFPELAAVIPQLMRHRCMLAFDDDGLIGVFILARLNDVLAEVHMCILPTAWGDRGLAAGCAFREWVWRNTAFERVVAIIALENRLAAKFTESVGLQQFAINPRAMIRRGRISDAAMYGITRGEQF
jgi:RimJ/RimL family protein N-acetyltransferase